MDRLVFWVPAVLRQPVADADRRKSKWFPLLRVLISLLPLSTRILIRLHSSQAACSGQPHDPIPASTPARVSCAAPGRGISGWGFPA